MKKAVSILLVMILAIGLLAGCNSNESASGDSNSKSGKQVELKIFIGQPRFKEQYQTYFDQFVAKEKEEKNIDVKIKLELPNVNQASQLLKTRLASGDSPDIFSLHAVNDIPLFNKAGYLEDLSDQPFVDKMYGTVKPAVTSTDGKVVAVPLETIQWGFMYNKKIFKDLNLKIPETYSEMEETIKILKQNKITPFLLTYKDAYIPQLFLPLTVGASVSTDNPDFIKNMNDGKGSFKEIKDMFNMMDLVNENGTKRAFENGQDQGAADFASGKAAMWVQGPWMSDSILNANKDFEFGVAPLPINDNPENTLLDISTSTSLAVSKMSKNKEVAKDLINYILDDQDSSDFYNSLGFNAVSTVHTFEAFPWLKESTEYVSKGKAYQDPAIPSAVKDESQKLFQSYLAGDISRSDVIKGLDRAWEQFNKNNK
ncbi:ABC transporter substrate-binding protein [Niallia nealsonii]|uniref:Sugar ABC transporter substrate-binding protein n=1 Tax=Niallia nealsonii TaxID=115979 RepID=A0A2N0YZU9_9BACI|nr:extracellular solute-binding protein [Niallia nealsonii]PKG22779.1 sugar ABC transporter substrate-binding protein [Niallia nealsonii]